MLRREKDRLPQELLTVTRRLDAMNQDIGSYQDIVKQGLDLAEHCGEAYASAPDESRRMFNQLFFERILVFPDDSIHGIHVQGHCTAPSWAPLGATTTGKVKRKCKKARQEEAANPIKTD